MECVELVFGAYFGEKFLKIIILIESFVSKKNESFLASRTYAVSNRSELIDDISDSNELDHYL